MASRVTGCFPPWARRLIVRALPTSRLWRRNSIRSVRKVKSHSRSLQSPTAIAGSRSMKALTVREIRRFPCIFLRTRSHLGRSPHRKVRDACKASNSASLRVDPSMQVRESRWTFLNARPPPSASPDRKVQADRTVAGWLSRKGEHEFPFCRLCRIFLRPPCSLDARLRRRYGPTVQLHVHLSRNRIRMRRLADGLTSSRKLSVRTDAQVPGRMNDILQLQEGP
jgi:hypothetical protein